MSTHHHRAAHTSGINYEQLGWKFKHQGNYEAAIDAFDKAIVRKQRTYFALHGNGECLLHLGKYSDALNCFEHAIKIDRRHAWAYHGAGRAYHYLQKFDLAIAYYNKSIEITRQSVVAWHWKGRTLIRMGENALAEEALNIALRNAIGSKHGKDATPQIEADLELAKTHKMDPSPLSNVTPNPNIIIYGDNNAPVNVGGIQATDDAILNRPIITGEHGSGWKDHVEPAIDKSAEQNPGNTKHSGIISRIFQKNTCPDCGTPIQNNQKYCNNCGRILE